MHCYRGGSALYVVSLTMPCLTPHFKNRQWKLSVKSHIVGSDFNQAKLECFLCEAHKCLLILFLLKSPRYHPPTQHHHHHSHSPSFRMTEANEAHFSLQGETCRTPQHYWSKGNGEDRNQNRVPAHVGEPVRPVYCTWIECCMINWFLFTGLFGFIAKDMCIDWEY